MKRIIPVLKTTFLLVVFAALNGCKEDTVIKAGITPGDNSFGTVSVGDTMTMITKTFFIDTLNTSAKITGLPVVQALGTVVDPFFGITNAGIYFQVLPTVNDFAFSSGTYVIDSAVLILPYSGVSWGNRSAPVAQKFKVYRMTEGLDVNTAYYSNQSKQTGDLLGEATVDMLFTITDTPTVIDKKAAYKHIRIPLSSSFVNDVQSRIGTSTFSTDANFLDYFKGFYVTPDSTANISANANLLPYILMDGGTDYSRAAVAFYFHENGGSETKTAFFNFVRDKTANFNRITRRYTGFPAQSFIDRYTATQNISDDTLILQNEPGACIDIRIPHIGSLPKSSIIKAELVFTKISTGYAADSLQTPNRLTVTGVDENGLAYTIRDFQASDANAAVSYVDGSKRTEKDNGGNDIIVYRINIAREVQKAIIDNRKELHLRVRGSQGFPGAYRFVAGGRNHPAYRTQLNLVYSKPY